MKNLERENCENNLIWTRRHFDFLLPVSLDDPIMLDLAIYSNPGIVKILVTIRMIVLKCLNAWPHSG